MIPTNEQETIALFAQLASELGYQFKRMGTRCPDAILVKDEKEVRVEFEHRSRNFERHKHDPSSVDLVICWQDDWDECPLPVLSLEVYVTLARGDEPPPVLPRWQRLLNWWREIRLTWIEHRAHIKKARMKLKKASYCKACGTEMKVTCDHEWIFEPNEGIENCIRRECPECHFYEIDGHFSSMW